MKAHVRRLPAARVNGQMFVLAAATLWGTTGTAQALAPLEAQPQVVGALRLMTGGFALLLLALLRGTLRTGRPWSRAATLGAAVCIAAYQVFFFAAVARTGVALGTIVGIGSSPVLGGLLGFLVRGERIERRWILATALAITGCTLLVITSGTLQVDLLGIFLAVGAGGTYATYTLFSKRLLEDQPPDAVTALVFSLGAVLLIPLLFGADLQWVAQPRGLAVVLHLGLITLAGAYTLFLRGLVTTPVGTAVTLTLAEPLTAGLLGVIVLGERLTSPGLLGAALIFGGIMLLSIGKRS